MQLGMTVLGDQELLVILNRARTLLTDPSHWASRHYAEDDTGRWVPVGSSRAVRFSLEGALVNAAGRDAREALPAILELFREVSSDAVVRLKPTSASLTHAEALELIDETMRRLSAPPVVTESGLRPSADAVDVPATRQPSSGRN